MPCDVSFHALPPYLPHGGSESEARSTDGALQHLGTERMRWPIEATVTSAKSACGASQDDTRQVEHSKGADGRIQHTARDRRDAGLVDPALICDLFHLVAEFH